MWSWQQCRDNGVESFTGCLYDFIIVVQLLCCVRLFATSWTIAHQALCPPLSPGVCSNSRALSWWCYLTISSSAILFSLLPSIFPSIPGSFPKRWLFTSGGQNIRASSSATVSLSNAYSVLISYGSTSLILLLSKRLSRVFSSTTIWKHQFFGIQPSLWSILLVKIFTYKLNFFTTLCIEKPITLKQCKLLLNLMFFTGVSLGDCFHHKNNNNVTSLFITL